METESNGVPGPKIRKRLTLEERKTQLEGRIEKSKQNLHAVEKLARKKQRQAETRLKIQIGAEFIKCLNIHAFDEAKFLIERLATMLEKLRLQNEDKEHKQSGEVISGNRNAAVALETRQTVTK